MSLSFACSISVGAGHLALDYIVRNDGDVEVGLFNRLSGNGDRSHFFEPTLLVIDLDDTQLSLRKQVETVPKPLKVLMEPIPYLTRLPAGQRFQETLRLPLPLRVHNLYRRALLSMQSRGPVEATRHANAETVSFSLGYFLNDGCVEFIPLGDEFSDIYRICPIIPAIERQQILSHTIRLTAPVPVLDYPAKPIA